MKKTMAVYTSTRMALAVLALAAPALRQADAQQGQAAQEAAQPQGVCRLSDFGPVDTPPNMKATFTAATNALAASGGVLCLTPAQSKALKPVNNAQGSWRTPPPPEACTRWGIGPGFTLVEIGEKKTRVLPPQVSGLEFDRTLRMDRGDSLPHWTTDHIVKMRNNLVHGSNSYLDWIQAPVKAGKDARFYVKSIRGIRPGQFLNLHGGPGYGGGVTRGYIKSIGYDQEQNMHYFVADTDRDHVAGAIVQNKNNVGLLYLEQNANCDEQTYDVMLRRRQYAGGDTYMFFAWYEYMSDIHSAAGDENGTLYGGYVKTLANNFRAKVKQVDWEEKRLTFEAGRNVETLSNSRPLINLNPGKHITAGHVRIVPPESYWETTDSGRYVSEGQTYPTRLIKNPVTGVSELSMGGVIRGDRDCPWDESIIGRFFAVTEETERVPKAKDLYRWYEITGLTYNADGTKDITIMRFWWGAKSAGSPTLYRQDNYTWDGHDRPLAYVIAPGTYANDITAAVPSEGFRAQPVLGLAPFGDAGSSADFAPGDAIEQAIGPDPFKPIPWRMWMWENVPGAFPAPVIDLANYGTTARHSALSVRGGKANKDDLEDTQTQRPSWDNVLMIQAAAQVGLNLAADFTKAAILFQQPYHDQPMTWQYAHDPTNGPREASLTVSRETGRLDFTGPGARFAGSITATGLSADATPARNLRGKNVPVDAGASTKEIAFAQAEADADYAVFIEQTWLSSRAVTRQTADGFTVAFDPPAPEGAKLHWMIVR